jgi:hypothetical protein
MKPGRELDALVAEKVMGFKVIETDECNGEDNLWLQGYEDQELPSYSTDVAAAWEVVEKLKLFQVKQTDSDGYTDYVQLWQDSEGIWTIGDWEDQLLILSEGESAPHAICLAALKAVGVKV